MSLADFAGATLGGEHPVIVFSCDAILSKDLVFSTARLAPTLKSFAVLTKVLFR